MELIGKIIVNPRHCGGYTGSKRRATWGSLMVGCDDGRAKKPVLIYRTTKTSSGTKYQLCENILSLHIKYLNEGRATVSFKEPNHDIFIDKADVTQLKKVCALIQQFTKSNNQPSTVPLPTLTLLKVFPTFTPPVTGINIRNKSEYAKTFVGANQLIDSHGQAVKKLAISNCLLKLAPRSIKKLTNLTQLILDNNDIRSSTYVEIESNVLQSICLINCAILSSLNLFASSSTYQYVNSLSQLILSGNNLERVPNAIFEFHNLHKLDLSNNRLTTIPDRFKSLSKLKHLTASNNLLSHIPSTIVTLRLNEVDFSGNPLLYGIIKYAFDANVYSLKELASRTVLNYNIKVEKDTIPGHLYEELIHYEQCVCGRKFIQGGQGIQEIFDLKQISTTVTYHEYKSSFIPIRGTLCHSYNSCYLPYIKNCKR